MYKFEIVCYKYGTYLYHIPEDGAILRPNVEVKRKYTIDIPWKPSRGRIHMLWTKKNRYQPYDNMWFPTHKALNEYRKEKGLKWGEVFCEEFISDESYSGHR